MLVEDIHDLIMMFILIVVFIILASGLKPDDREDKFVYESLELRDEEEVFFLNLLKTKVDDKTIGDLIILSENEDLTKEIKKEIEDVLDLYGKANYEYGLIIDYPNEEVEDQDFGCVFGIEGKGIKQNLPSLNKGLIKLQFAFQGGECFISPIQNE